MNTIELKMRKEAKHRWISSSDGHEVLNEKQSDIRWHVLLSKQVSMCICVKYAGAENIQALCDL